MGQATEAALLDGRFDVVVIATGVKVPVHLMLLFERDPLSREPWISRGSITKASCPTSTCSSITRCGRLGGGEGGSEFGAQPVGKRVALIGAGGIGFDVAEYLSEAPAAKKPRQRALIFFLKMIGHGQPRRRRIFSGVGNR